MTQDPNDAPSLVDLAAGIVAAYVSHNRIARADLPDLIGSVHGSLRSLEGPQAPEPLRPPVPVARTITPDHIVSLEDGKPYRSLKRHLTAQGLTPDAYRAKWGLPRDYPMVAANYSKRRAELARALGLGRQGSRPEERPDRDGAPGRQPAEEMQD